MQALAACMLKSHRPCLCAGLIVQPTHPPPLMTTTRCALWEQGSQAKCQGRGANRLQRQLWVPQAAL